LENQTEKPTPNLRRPNNQKTRPQTQKTKKIRTQKKNTFDKFKPENNEN
jgi:hypothetical protein